MHFRSRPMLTGTVLSLAAVVSMGLAACGSSSGAGAGAVVNGKNCLKVGVLLPESATSARWEGDDHPDLVKDITTSLPGSSIDYYNANGDSATQLQQSETALSKGDCILVLAPQDSQQAATIVDNAFKSKVPVISYDRLTYSNNLNYYVSFDNVKVGELQGQYISDHYSSYVSAGHSNIAFIDGSQTDNNALLFKKGAHSVLDPIISSGKLTSVYEQFTPGWVNGTAQTEMEGALTAASNNIQIAYVANDGMAGTVIAALTAQHLNGKVLVTGQDATVAGIQQILIGNQAMTVYKPINLEAQATADLVAAISKGNSTDSITNGATTAIPVSGGASIPSVLETPKSVDASNIASTVIADGFVKASDVCSGLPAGTKTNGICPGS